MFTEFIANLKIKLQQPLPGEKAQFEMAHVKRQVVLPQSLESKNYLPSAVLILLYPNDHNETILLLIERVTYDGYHSGQIALPGGKAEPTDIDLRATALREFFEETGANKTPEVIGKLTPVYIPVSKFMVQPFVAFLNERPQFNIHAREVQQLIEWPFTNFIDAETVKQTTIEPSPGLKLHTPYFDVQDKILWGATAMIMNELKWVINS
ncbi:MAG: CoA pyrophosphatase [Bacteroidota bacterium]